MWTPKKIEDLDLSKEEAWEYLTNLAQVVQIKHYPGHEEAEDLKSEALCKAVDMIKAANKPVIRSVRSYLYTGMRNTMSNYLYHLNKTTPLDDMEIPHKDEEPVVINPEQIVRTLRPIASDRSQGIILIILQRVMQGEPLEDVTPPDIDKETERALVIALNKAVRQIRG